MINSQDEDAGYMEWMKRHRFEEWKKIQEKAIARMQKEIREAEHERKYM
jgi:hypothetical protein